MKVAVSATRASLDAEVDPRFGRCSCFVVVNIDDMSHEIVDNGANQRGGGAGIQAAQQLANRGVEVVLTGSVGPNAHETLAAAGIGVVVDNSGTVREAIQRWKNGGIAFARSPNATPHGGLGA